jgi:hypothetical protein
LRRLLSYFFARKGSLFGREHSGTLSLFRFLYCGFVALEVASAGKYVEEDYRTERAYHAIPLFEPISPEPLPFVVMQVLRVVLTIALSAAALGVLTRPALWLSFLGFFLYEGTALGFTKSPDSNYVYHMSNLTVFALFLLAIAPGVGRHGVVALLKGESRPKPIPEWPRKTIIGLLSIAYFGAFYCRMAESPLWADGYTIQGYLMERAVIHDVDLALEVAQNWWVCFGLGVATLLFEATFLLVLFFPRLAWIYLPSGFMLHLSIDRLMAIDFFEYFILAYFAFLEWPAVVAMFRRLFGPPAALDPVTATRRVPTWQRAICVAMLAMQGVCVVARIENWPFSDFRVYSKRRHPDDVKVLLLARRDAEGHVDPLPHRIQQEFRRATRPNRLRSLAADATDAPHHSRSRLVGEIRDLGLRTIGEHRPHLLTQARGIALYVKRARLDEASGRYVVAMDFVCDLVAPRHVAGEPDDPLLDAEDDS